MNTPTQEDLKQIRIEQLEAQVEKLDAENQGLRARIESLELLIKQHDGCSRWSTSDEMILRGY